MEARVPLEAIAGPGHGWQIWRTAHKVGHLDLHSQIGMDLVELLGKVAIRFQVEGAQTRHKGDGHHALVDRFLRRRGHHKGRRWRGPSPLGCCLQDLGFGLDLGFSQGIIHCLVPRHDCLQSLVKLTGPHRFPHHISMVDGVALCGGQFLIQVLPVAPGLCRGDAGWHVSEPHG